VRLGVAALGRTGRTVLRLARAGFTLLLILYLGWQLSAVGWRQVLAGVPRSPWFYLAYGALFGCLPACEGLVWRRLWRWPLRRSLPVLMRKRAYSRHLLDYSGEVYLYGWACRRVDRPAGELLHTIKDNAIVSSVMSGALAVAALLGLLLVAPAALPAACARRLAGWGLAALLAAAAVAGLAWVCRRRLLWLPRRQIGFLAAVHAGRLGCTLLLELAVWMAALPAVPLRSWLLLLAVETVISRIPFLPNRDLLLLGTGVQIAGAIQIPPPALAGLLVATSVLERALNLLVLALGALARDGRRQPGEGPSSGPEGQPGPDGAQASARRPGGAHAPLPGRVTRDDTLARAC